MRFVTIYINVKSVPQIKMNYVLDHVDSKMRRFVFTIKKDRERKKPVDGMS